MGILDGGIRELFSTAFGGFYLDGIVHYGTRTPIYEGARITGYIDPGDLACKVQTDRLDSTTKSGEDYAEGDVRLIVLSLTPATDGRPALDIVITTESQVTDGYGQRFRIMGADLDAGRSHWVCHGRPV